MNGLATSGRGKEPESEIVGRKASCGTMSASLESQFQKGVS